MVNLRLEDLACYNLVIIMPVELESDFLGILPSEIETDLVGEPLNERERKRFGTVLHRETAARLITALSAFPEVGDLQTVYRWTLDNLPLGYPFYLESFLKQYRQILPDVLERARIVALLDHFKLTADQYSSVLFVSMGLNNEEIASVSGISPDSVAGANTRIMKKIERGLVGDDIKVNTREAISYVALASGLVPSVVTHQLVNGEAVDAVMQNLSGEEIGLLLRVLPGHHYSSMAREPGADSAHTIEGRTNGIIQKLGCRDRSQLALYYFAWLRWKEATAIDIPCV